MKDREWQGWTGPSTRSVVLAMCSYVHALGGVMGGQKQQYEVCVFSFQCRIDNPLQVRERGGS